MKNGIIVQHIKLTIAIPIKLEAIIQLVTPGLMLLKLSNSPIAQASIRVVKKPKKPIKPKKLNTSPDFFIKYSQITFSKAYKNAPDKAIKSPSRGATEVYFSFPKWIKSLIKPIEIPITQIKIPR